MVCLETSFLVSYLRGDEKARLIWQKFERRGEVLTIASPSIIELISGAELEEIKKEKEEIIGLLSSLIILPLDKGSAVLAGEIEASLILSGQVIGIADIMIGAIALHNNERLITKNKKHFERINGLEIESY